MPAALEASEKAEMVRRLFVVFRDRGYEGASLADLSKATALGKSSLYHHFPGGKEAMAEAVLEQAREFVAQAVAEVAASGEPMRVRVRKIAASLEAVYEGGTTSCVLGRLAVAELGKAGHRVVGEIFALWAGAVAVLARESGMTPVRAQQFAEDWLARLQGSLVLQAATGDRGAFERTLGALLELGRGR